MRKIIVVSFLLACVARSAFAQTDKVIILTDSLTANADKFQVDIHQFIWSFTKFPKIAFGGYTTISGKWNHPLSPDVSNIWGTKTTSKAARKYSFVLIDSLQDTVKVSGVMATSTQTYSPLQVKNVTLAGEDREIDAGSLTAKIALTNDPTHVWTLWVMTETGGEADKYEGWLSDGASTLQVIPVRSSHYALGAYGFDFTQGDKFYSAYQFYVKRTNMTKVYKIYLDKALDTKMKMILNGAMTALIALRN